MLITRLIKNLRPILILSVAIGLAGLLITFSKKPTPKPRSETAWPVEVRQVEKGAHSSNTIVFGQIESQQKATLRATVEGNILQTPGKEGLFVKKQDLLVLIDPNEAELEVQRRAAEVSRIEAELRSELTRLNADKKILTDQQRLIELLDKSVSREKKLKSQSVGSQARIDEAEQASVRDSISVNERQFSIENYPNRKQVLEAQLQRAKAELALAKLDLFETNIIAPFSGRISKRDVAIGDRVQPNQSVISMYDTSQLEIRAEFPTTTIDSLQNALDQQKLISANIIGSDEQLDIKLDRLAGEISQNQGGIDALFTIKHDNPPLRLGQTVKLLVNYPEQNNVFVVPQTALYDTDSGYTIFKLEKNNDEYRLQSYPVSKIGSAISMNGMNEAILASEHFHNKDLVLVTRLPYARDGLKVTLSE